MHKGLLAVFFRNIDIVLIHRAEDLIPKARIDQQALLRAPIVDELDAVHIRLRPFFHMAAVKVVHPRKELQQLRRRVHQVHVQLLRGTDKLQLLKRARAAARQYKAVRAAAERVDLVYIEGEQLLGNMHPAGVAPILLGNKRLLDLTDNALRHIIEHTAPLIDEGPHLVGVPLHRRVFLQPGRGPDDVGREIAVNLRDGIAVMIRGPGQRPLLPRHTAAGVAKLQGRPDQLSGC